MWFLAGLYTREYKSWSKNLSLRAEPVEAPMSSGLRAGAGLELSFERP